jgi:hypothetical protein
MYRFGMRLVWLSVLALAACSERKAPHDDRPAPPPIPPPPPMKDIDDIGDPNDPREANPASDDWSTTKTCAVQDAELIYLVDDTSHFLSFDPRKLPGDALHLIGTLRCTKSSSPNSMAIDRKGVAWVGYQNGKVYRASIIDAHCDPKGWKPSGKPTRVFGMGYVTKGPRTEEEMLFVAGGVDDPGFSLATIDTVQKSWNPIAQISVHAHAELTGTSEGRLYAYFPSPGRGFVQELDRAKGTTIGPVWRIPGDPYNIDAYAFAHYAGVFYVFTTVDGVSGIHAIHKDTGKVEIVANNLSYKIVGAGVSTCAPLLEQPAPP